MEFQRCGSTPARYNHYWSSFEREEVEGGSVSFYSSMPHLMDFYRSNEENALRRLKEKYSDELKRICQTMGWRDYNQGNLSAFDGDLGPVEAKMRQNSRTRREKGRKREDEVKTEKARRHWGVIFGRAQRRFIKTKEGKIRSLIFYSFWIKDDSFFSLS